MALYRSRCLGKGRTAINGQVATHRLNGLHIRLSDGRMRLTNVDHPCSTTTRHLWPLLTGETPVEPGRIPSPETERFVEGGRRPPTVCDPSLRDTVWTMHISPGAHMAQRSHCASCNATLCLPGQNKAEGRYDYICARSILRYRHPTCSAYAATPACASADDAR